VGSKQETESREDVSDNKGTANWGKQTANGKRRFV